MARGILPRDLGGLEPGTGLGAINFVMPATTVSGTTTYTLFAGTGAPYPCRVIGFFGILTAAGSAGMTVALQDKNSAAITDTIDVSALPLNAVFDCATLDTTKAALKKGDTIKIITASNPLSVCYATLIKT